MAKSLMREGVVKRCSGGSRSSDAGIVLRVAALKFVSPAEQARQIPHLPEECMAQLEITYCVQ